MTVHFLVDCRDEELEDTSPWFSPEENLCGLIVIMDTVKLYLTSEQINTIMIDWKANEKDMKNKLSQSLLRHKENLNVTEKN